MLVNMPINNNVSYEILFHGFTDGQTKLVIEQIFLLFNNLMQYKSISEIEIFVLSFQMIHIFFEIQDNITIWILRTMQFTTTQSYHYVLSWDNRLQLLECLTTGSNYLNYLLIRNYKKNHFMEGGDNKSQIIFNPILT